MTDQDKKKDYYKGEIKIEGIIGGHITRMSIYRDNNNHQYASSVETLILMCPPEIAEKALEHMQKLKLQRCQYQSMGQDKMILYDDLWMYINNLLKKDNIIYKTGYFEVGFD